MNICGIDIPENAECTLIGWPYGTDTSIIARLKVRTNKSSEIHNLTELISGLRDEFGLDNALMGEMCTIQFPERQNGNETQNNGESVMAEIISGLHKGEFIYLKIKGKETSEENT